MEDIKKSAVDPTSIQFIPDVCYGAANGIPLFLDILKPVVPFTA